MYKKKFQSTTTNYSTSETTTQVIYYGSATDMDDLKLVYYLSGVYTEGTLKSMDIQRKTPLTYEVTLNFIISSSGTTIDNPDDYAYGKKSCTLRGSLLSMPLEAHANYKVCWNYYLASAPDYSTVPSTWATTTTQIFSDTLSENLVWIKSSAELPTTTDGQRWKILKEPTMPGVLNYDVAVYTISENAKYTSAKSAGEAVANQLNKIGTPSETFNITGGTWKCDDANVQWNGNYWLASLTWTLSGDSAGWNSLLYN